MPTPNILIALPAYGGWTRNACVSSLAALIYAFSARGWSSSFLLQDGHDISYARSFLATVTLGHPVFSHILMIDYDMEFKADQPIRLIEADRDVIGYAYVKRGTDPRRALTPEDFCLRPKHPMRIENGIGDMDWIGMGLTAIKRSVFERMHATGKLRVQSKGRSGFDGPVYGFFDRLYPEGNEMGEDFSFCHRWQVLCSGEVYAVVDEAIGHIGDFSYTGTFADALRVST